MRYISLDLETSGTNDEIHQILEIGAVVDDLEKKKPLDELPEFHTYVEHDTYRVSKYCLGMHSDTGIFERISDYDGESDARLLEPTQAILDLNTFVRHQLEPEGIPGQQRGNVNVCGHNLRVFDFRFLRRVIDKHYHDHVREPTIWDVNRIRTFDPCQWWMREDDDKVPGTKTAMERAGMEPSVEHTAVADAKDMVEMTRRHFE